MANAEAVRRVLWLLPGANHARLGADTWWVVVIYALGERPRRYSELQERIGGISKKMLTQTVRK
jgi:DNA-binding HxlR family transcriptional regulator